MCLNEIKHFCPILQRKMINELCSLLLFLEILDFALLSINNHPTLRESNAVSGDMAKRDICLSVQQRF